MMAEARQRADWARTSTLLSMLNNCHRDPKKSSPSRPSDFDPYAPRPKPIKVPLSDLKAFFVKG